jgi:hypothetical protein
MTDLATKNLRLISTDFFKDCYLSKFAPENPGLIKNSRFDVKCLRSTSTIKP